MNVRLFVLVAWLVTTGTPGGPHPARAEGTAPAEPSRVVRKAFQLRFRSPESVVTHLQPLLSKAGKIQIAPSRGRIVVADYPAQMDAIQRVIERFDVPIRNIELVVKLMEGRRTGTGEDGQNVELPEVIQKMRDFLRFEHYRVLSSSYVKATELQPVLVQMGDYRLRFTTEWVIDPPDIIRLVDLRLEKGRPSAPVKGPSGARKSAPAPVYEAILATTLNLRSGEPTVVGTAPSEESNSMLLLLLQARVLAPGGS